MGLAAGVGASCASCGLGGWHTSTGVILVLFILLVIVSRAWI
ncbi:YjcZ family sporulation protein [Paenibacillus sp. LMG 31456]|uniref:YjcZ family sporulation protein n=1 Tax=Paenibacillus foliorum TaxID=2654974 RepID=A0A972K1R8_9BACL|nr:YjcZ family sporulation protein [Paenibacillus foliorum]NOU93082.1 YjcZ family sporulation protein [Paenibacillus foliorum]